MQLELIRQITAIDLTDKDLLIVCRVLWDITPKKSKPALRKVIFDSLVNQKDLDLSEELIEALINGMKRFRDEVGFQRSQCIRENDSFTKLFFLRAKLGYSDEEVEPLLEKACEEGNEDAIKLRYVNVVQSENTNPEEKLRAGHAAVGVLGKKKAMNILALAYCENEDEENYLKTILEGAEEGNTYCCWKAAMYYQRQKDFKKAAQLFEIGRFDPDPDAAFEYALTFWIEGYGRRDCKYAEDLMLRAALSGSAEAAAHLGKSCLWGLMYREGQKDYVKARCFLEMAEELGHEDAGYFVGCLWDGFYEDEPEGFVDHDEAIKHWEALARRGHGNSLMQLGCAYYNGDHGYVKDHDLAWMYYRESISNDSPLGGAYYADMIAANEAPGSKPFAIWLFVNGMSAYGDSDRNYSKQCFADAYTYGKTFPKDEEWSSYIRSFEVEYQGSSEETFRWIAERLVHARLEHVKAHPELDDGVDWAKMLLK